MPGHSRVCMCVYARLDIHRCVCGRRNAHLDTHWCVCVCMLAGTLMGVGVDTHRYMLGGGTLTWTLTGVCVCVCVCVCMLAGTLMGVGVDTRLDTHGCGCGCGHSPGHSRVCVCRGPLTGTLMGVGVNACLDIHGCVCAGRDARLDTQRVCVWGHLP